MLGAEVPENCQEHLTQTLLVRLLKTHFLTPTLDQQNRIELVTRPATPAADQSYTSRWHWANIRNVHVDEDL